MASIFNDAAGSSSGVDGARHAPRSQSWLTRKIWLPKIVYNALPAFYLLSGLTALYATLYISHWLWVLPHYLLFSAACVHMALLIYRRRRRPHNDGL